MTSVSPQFRIVMALYHLWEAASGKVLQVLEGHTEEVVAVTWSPDGQNIAYISLRDQKGSIWKMTAMGLNQTNLTPDFEIKV